ncbi:class I SAM-dependent RNA methyltransferase [Acaricomes phytoseiuli]|uniref:class I SAM-dependent RNA methyltransferase n=1 Tax=Acaricomes phytoseiuli TaxID=291968 RepID=UPI00037FDEBE|nr:TRAM domain-containing protein [Acaricomes phytoseiuli]
MNGAAVGGEPAASVPDRIELTVGPVAHGGHCVARYEGRVVFVRHALPGERVLAAVTEADPGAAFWRADAATILESSPHRVPHFWPAADAQLAYAAGGVPVGGAEFGHIALLEQHRLKAQVLAEQLRRLAGQEWDIPVEDVPVAGASVEPVPDPGPTDGLGWRTRAGFTVSPAGRLGMYAHRSERILPVDDMPLAVPAIRELARDLHGLDLHGVQRIDLTAPGGEAGGEAFVLLAGERSAAARVAAELPDGTSAAHKSASRGMHRLRGRSWVSENVGGRYFRVSGEGFWQIHRSAPELLSEAVRSMLTDGLGAGQRAADLYAGAGLFTALLADLVGPAGRVLSIEGSPVTSKDARGNFRAETQVMVRPGRVDRVLRSAVSELGGRLDAVILDPPRAGAGRAVVRQIASSKPGRVVYVSCDPASFARDVKYFAEAGWQLKQLRAFDLYPHTHHLETVALLVPGD